MGDTMQCSRRSEDWSLDWWPTIMSGNGSGLSTEDRFNRTLTTHIFWVKMSTRGATWAWFANSKFGRTWINYFKV